VFAGRNQYQRKHRGRAELDESIKDPDEVIARADKALYEATRQGKNKVSQWPPDKEENSKP